MSNIDLDKAVVNHILSDTEGDQSLRALVGSKVFNNTLFLMRYNHTKDTTNFLPRVRYATEYVESTQDKQVDALLLHITGKNEDEVKKIAGRLREIFTGPYSERSQLKRVQSPSVRIGSISTVSNVDETTFPNQEIVRALVFEVKYTNL